MMKKNRVCGITSSAPTQHGKVMDSMLGRCTMDLVLVPDARCSALMLKAWPRCIDCVISKDIKMLCQIHDINSTSRENALGLNRRNSLP